MTFTDIAAFLSTALAIYCTVPYIRAILTHKTKPHQLSWLIVVIMNGILCLTQFFVGGRGSVLVSLIFFISSLIVFLLSLKFGTRNTSRWDQVLFTLALVTIVIWLLTRSNDIAIWLTLLIDLAATAMMVLKIKKTPHSEDPHPWLLAAVAWVFSCLTFVGTPLGILYVRPLYGLIGNIVFVAFILYYQKKSKSTTETSPAEL